MRLSALRKLVEQISAEGSGGIPVPNFPAEDWDTVQASSSDYAIDEGAIKTEVYESTPGWRYVILYYSLTSLDEGDNPTGRGASVYVNISANDAQLLRKVSDFIGNHEGTLEFWVPPNTSFETNVQATRSNPADIGGVSAAITSGVIYPAL